MFTLNFTIIVILGLAFFIGFVCGIFTTKKWTMLVFESFTDEVHKQYDTCLQRNQISGQRYE